MSFDAPANPNYAAVIVQVPEPVKVPNLDNLVGVPMFGFQALTQASEVKAGDLKVLFTAETQLRHEYACENNLYREATLNKDAEQAGYLEVNGRVKAIRLRKQQSDALLMPLESLAYTGYDIASLKPGDTFDSLNGHDICRKYVNPHAKAQGAAAGPKIRVRVNEKRFPMHLDTVNLFRNLVYFRKPRHVIYTQKLHGTSWRGGYVAVDREKSWFERVLAYFGYFTPDFEYEETFGSRRVIKGKSWNNHYYKSDVWADYGAKLKGLIPKNFMVYGELVGWKDETTPIQKGYTYDLKPGTSELYVYRVATVNNDGVIADLSWEGVKDFCRSVGLKWTPELRVDIVDLYDELEDDLFVKHIQRDFLDTRYHDKVYSNGEAVFPDALRLSDPKSVDEGICVRLEGMIPRVFKAKSPLFLTHESKQLDTGEVDLESAA